MSKRIITQFLLILLLYSLISDIEEPMSARSICETINSPLSFFKLDEKIKIEIISGFIHL